MVATSTVSRQGSVPQAVAGILVSKWLRWTRIYGLVMVAVFAAMFGYSVVAVHRPAVDLLNAGWAANWLHLGLVVAGLVIAAAPARVRVSRFPR